MFSTQHSLSLFLMNADGTNQKPLKTYKVENTEYIQQGSYPTWSPDGEKIAFHITNQFIPPQVYLYDFESDTVTSLLDPNLGGDRAVWSQDGSRLAFRSKRDYQSEGEKGQDIYELEISTGEIRRITTDGLVRRFTYDPNNDTYLIEKNSSPYEWYTLDVVTLDTVENELESLNLPLDPTDVYYHNWTTNGSYMIIYHKKEEVNSYSVYDYQNDELIELNIPLNLNVGTIDIR